MKTPKLPQVLSLLTLAACGLNKRIPPEAPVPGTGIVASNRTTSSISLSWGEATDNKTLPALLEYKLYSSTSNNIRSLEEAAANGQVVFDWTPATTATVLSGLSSSTTYYFALAVRDEDAKEKLYAPISATTKCDGKAIYTVAVANGAFGGASGADALCSSAKPSTLNSSVVRAMVHQDAIRVACSSANCGTGNGEHVNWVFAPYSDICTSDYELRVGTTNGVALLDATRGNILGDSNDIVYTGLRPDWQGHHNCFAWSTTASTSYHGSSNATGSDFHSKSTTACTAAGAIYCVEQ
jgi:hypothetical protein